MTGTAVVTTDQGGSSAPAPTGLFGLTGAQVYSSLPETDKALIVSLMQGKAEPLGDHVGEVIEPVHVLGHLVEITDEKTQETAICPRVVIITADGTAYQCVSEGIRRSVALLMHYYGQAPWKGLRTKIEQVNTRAGRRTYLLTPQ